MTQITYDTIMALNPCYNPVDIGMPIDYSDTLLNFCKVYRNKVKNLQDINWVAMRVLDEKIRNKYVLWCVQQVVHLMKDKRSKDAVIALENYNNGKLSKEELRAAADAAYADAAVAYAAAYADAAYADAAVAYAAADAAVAYAAAYAAAYADAAYADAAYADAAVAYAAVAYAAVAYADAYAAVAYAAADAAVAYAAAYADAAYADAAYAAVAYAAAAVARKTAIEKAINAQIDKLIEILGE